MNKILFALFVACLLTLAAVAIWQETRPVVSVDFDKHVQAVDRIVTAGNAYGQKQAAPDQTRAINVSLNPGEISIDPISLPDRQPDVTSVVDGLTIEFWERRVGDKTEDGAIRITQGDKVLLSKSIYLIELTYKRRVTADDHPDLVFNGWTGGANCCGVQYIISTQPEFHIVSIMSPVLTFKDEEYEPGFATQQDENIRNVFSCGGCVTYPSVEYRLTDTGWIPDPDAMRANAPTQTELEAQLNEMETIRCTTLDGCSTTDTMGFTSLLVRLTYADRLDTVLELIDRYSTDANREVLTAEFLRKLASLNTTAMLYSIFGWEESDLLRI